MVRRSKVASFVGGFYVFPGGTLDDADSSALVAELVPGVAADMAPWVAAAIRETAEEVGVLLTEEPRAELAANASRLSSAEFYADVAASGTRLRGRDLAYFANWITPESEPKRFDTRFFIVALDERHDAVADGFEITDAVWVRPDVALNHAEAGRWGVIFPTWKTLELLAGFDSTGAAIEHARAIDVEARQPRVVRASDGSIRVLLPGEPEWSLAEGLNL